MDVRDEGPVDLQFVGGDLRQGGQRRIADPEIVDGDLRSNVPDEGQDLPLKTAFREERLLGELKDEAFRDTGLPERLTERRHERESHACLAAILTLTLISDPKASSRSGMA